MRAPAVVVWIAALALAVSGFAVAAATRSSRSTSVIHACVKKKAGTVRIVTSAKQCRRRERSVSWNRQGPVGVTGRQGSAGTAGAPGSALAYAHVDSAGNLDASRTKGPTATKLGTGSLCYVVSPPPVNVTTAVEESIHFVFATVDPLRIPSGCPAGTNAFARTIRNGTALIEEAPYYIAFN
jgi:hypothetical protein